MQINLKNKVRQTELGRDKGLRPVLEAIANAFDAIAETGSGEGKTIIVRILRGKTDKRNLPQMGTINRPVIGFEVEDEGIGFNDTHFRSFQEAYTSQKQHTGGKGCGRFLWLKAFITPGGNRATRCYAA